MAQRSPHKPMVSPWNTKYARGRRSREIDYLQRGERYTQTKVAEEERDVVSEMCHESSGVNMIWRRSLE